MVTLKPDERVRYWPHIWDCINRLYTAVRRKPYPPHSLNGTSDEVGVKPHQAALELPGRGSHSAFIFCLIYLHGGITAREEVFRVVAENCGVVTAPF